MATKADICNMALRKLGAIDKTPVTAATLSAGSTKPDRICEEFYAETRDQLLSMFPWRFATRHTALTYTTKYPEHNSLYDYDAVVISGVTNANPAVATTATAHGLSTGDGFEILDVTGLVDDDGNSTLDEARGQATVLTTTTFELDGFDSTNYSAYSSGGTVTRHEILDKYAAGYTYDLPSDFLAAVQLEDDTSDYEIVNGRIVTTVENAVLIYIRQITTEASFTNEFVQSFAALLASVISLPILGVGEKGLLAAEKMEEKFILEFGRNTTIDAKSQRYTPNTSSFILNSR
jgi:hypothetical protein